MNEREGVTFTGAKSLLVSTSRTAIGTGTTGFAHIVLSAIQKPTDPNAQYSHYWLSLLYSPAVLALFNHIMPGYDPNGSALFDNQNGLFRLQYVGHVPVSITSCHVF